jgi:hypothetical protein
VNAVVYATAGLFGMACFILLDGLLTVQVYRRGGLHQLLARVPVGAELPLAPWVTFCGCMTQGPVATWAQRGEGRRAARFLGWAATLRPMALSGLALWSPRAAVVLLLAGIGYGLALGALPDPISPGATFLVRRPVGLGDWFSDSVRETGWMLRAFGVVLVACAAAGGVVFALPDFGWPWWAGVFGLLGLLVPVDLVATMPVLVALALHGAPVALVAGLGAGALVSARRAERLVRGYLRVERWTAARWRAALYVSAVTFGTMVVA